MASVGKPLKSGFRKDLRRPGHCCCVSAIKTADNQSGMVPEHGRHFIIMESHCSCFRGIVCFASNTLPSKRPLNSLPVEVQWVGSPAVWDSTPSNLSEPGRPQNLP